MVLGHSSCDNLSCVLNVFILFGDLGKDTVSVMFNLKKNRDIYQLEIDKGLPLWTQPNTLFRMYDLCSLYIQNIVKVM